MIEIPEAVAERIAQLLTFSRVDASLMGSAGATAQQIGDAEADVRAIRQVLEIQLRERKGKRP